MVSNNALMRPGRAKGVGAQSSPNLACCALGNECSSKRFGQKVFCLEPRCRTETAGRSGLAREASGEFSAMRQRFLIQVFPKDSAVTWFILADAHQWQVIRAGFSTEFFFQFCGIFLTLFVDRTEFFSC